VTTDGAERPLFDPGLQPERTSLAWRRTGLALTVASLLSVRVLPVVLGPWATVPAVLGLVAALTVLVLAHRRQRVLQHALARQDGGGVLGPGGRLLLFTAVVVSAGGAAASSLVLAAGGFF